MIEATQKKLREAQFFNTQLTLERDRRGVKDQEVFLYYLSAFVSAGRSVTFVLQAEEKAKYDAWFPAWSSSLGQEERELLHFMNQQRVAEVHREGAETLSHLELVPVTEFGTDDHGHPAYGLHWFGPPDTPMPKVGRYVHYFRPGGEAEVTATCGSYVQLLERLVRDFMQANSEPAPDGVASEPKS